jgi:hypothetical protein
MQMSRAHPDESADSSSVRQSDIHMFRYDLCTFPSTAEKKAARRAFTVHDVAHQIDWSCVLSTEESCCVLNGRRLARWHRSKITDDICHAIPKFPPESWFSREFPMTSK